MLTIDRIALQATLHLTCCAIGEIAGLVISSALNWHQAVSIVLATLLALVFGYSFASGPLVGVGMSVGEAARVGWIQERLAP